MHDQGSPADWLESPLELVDHPYFMTNVPNWRWETTIPDYFNFWYAVAGTGSFFLNGGWQRLEPGMAFVFPPGYFVRGRQESEEPVTNFSLHVRFRNQQAAQNALQPLLAGHRVRLREQIEELLHSIARCSRSGHEAARVQTRLLAAVWVVQLWRDWSEPEIDEAGVRILNLVEEIDLHPSRRWDWNLAAHRCGLSRAQFNRLFRSHTGTSPANYIIECRMQRARALLESSPMRIGEIAQALGYSDVYYFSRQFRERMGVSPRVWRER